MHAQDVTELAKASLLQNADPAMRNVRCEFRQGMIILRGTLHSFYHKQLAQEAVARIEGVLRVINEIEVVSKSD